MSDDATVLRAEARRAGVPPHVKRVLLRAARLVAADDEARRALLAEEEMRNEDTKPLGPVRQSGQLSIGAKSERVATFMDAENRISERHK